jgi:SAM-dependent methyltransferase
MIANNIKIIKKYLLESIISLMPTKKRERLLWFYLEEYTDFFKPPKKKILHVAPEIVLSDRIKQNKFIEYLSADLDPTRAMIGMDLTDIKINSNFFDVIICNLVLEHIPDHKKAMREIYRVLKTGGWAILQVPILGEQTFVDPDATTPEEKKTIEFLGLPDHEDIYFCKKRGE